MKVRKKSIIVEAEQFDPCGKHKLELPEGVIGISSPNADNWAYEGCKFYIDTLEGRFEVKAGDWIITGVECEKYPIRPNIFEKTYEIVEP